MSNFFIKRLKDDIRQPWTALYMDGRNEHGTHLLDGFVSARIENVERLIDGLGSDAELIFASAERLGHSTGNMIVAIFKRCGAPDEDWWEFVSISPLLTELMFGTPSEQTEGYEASPQREGDRPASPNDGGSRHE